MRKQTFTKPCICLPCSFCVKYKQKKCKCYEVPYKLAAKSAQTTPTTFALASRSYTYILLGPKRRKEGIEEGVQNVLYRLQSVDLHSFFVDSDPGPAVLLNADPDPGPAGFFNAIQIRTQLKVFFTNFLVKSFLELKKTKKDCSKV